MLLHGDELGRTQQGNNNTYAQDSELSWVHWDQADQPLVEFTAMVSRLRREHPTFRRKRFFTGREVRTGGNGDDRLNDIVWLHADGRPMADDDWQAGQALGMYLNGNGIAGADPRGERIVDDHFLLYFNAGPDCDVVLPPEEYAAAWDVVIDTCGVIDGDNPHPADGKLVLHERSTLVLREHAPAEDAPDGSVAASVEQAQEQAQERAQDA
jgi:glycogen operon protein